MMIIAQIGLLAPLSPQNVISKSALETMKTQGKTRGPIFVASTSTCCIKKLYAQLCINSCWHKFSSMTGAKKQPKYVETLGALKRLCNMLYNIIIRNITSSINYWPLWTQKNASYNYIIKTIIIVAHRYMNSMSMI